jgi:hypothetical protein
MVIERARGLVSEMIGRTRTIVRQILVISAPSRDLTQADYAFWDRARRGKAEGLKISGLLIKPVVSKIAAWGLGRPPTLEIKQPKAKEKVNEWWQKHHSDILRAYEDSLALGDAYLVINPDLSVTSLPPNAVTPVVDEENQDFGTVIGWKIIQKHPHPTRPGDSVTIEDTFTAGERLRKTYRQGALVKEERYANLIGRVPVVKISNNVGSNELYGSPEVEALIEALHEYGDVLDAGLNGNKRQGRPTPKVKFPDVKALAKFWDQYAKKVTRTLSDGSTETYETIPFNADQVMAVVGDFDYAQPGSFASDTEILLGLLYLLFLEHTELPEFILGSAISSSKASAESQMEPFVKFIEKKRGQAEGWILEIVGIVLAYLALTEVGVRAETDVAVVWELLTQQDGQLTKDTVAWAYGENLIDGETALALAPIEIENPAAVFARAQGEAQQRKETALEYDLQNLLQRGMRQEEQDGGDVERAEAAA